MFTGKHVITSILVAIQGRCKWKEIQLASRPRIKINATLFIDISLDKIKIDKKKGRNVTNMNSRHHMFSPLT
jgi:hypothetical protein